MDTANVVEAILNNVATLLPMRIVRGYERGVLFRWGTDVAELGAGLHWFLPGRESIEIVNVAPEVRNLPTQSVMTKDGHAVTFSCNVCYRITDARKMFTSVQSFDDAMTGYAMVHLAASIGGRTFASLKRNREDLEIELAETLTSKVRNWGAVIEWCGITDLVEARAYRLYGDPFPLGAG